MRHRSIEVDERGDGARDLVAGEGADRRDRTPAREDEKFHPAGMRGAQQRDTDKSVDAPQFGQHLFSEMADIALRVRRRRAPPPSPDDHDATPPPWDENSPRSASAASPSGPGSQHERLNARPAPDEPAPGG